MWADNMASAGSKKALACHTSSHFLLTSLLIDPRSPRSNGRPHGSGVKSLVSIATTVKIEVWQRRAHGCCGTMYSSRGKRSEFKSLFAARSTPGDGRLNVPSIKLVLSGRTSAPMR